MLKEKVIENISDTGIIAVIRADTIDQALKISEACQKGGVKVLEITFTIPNAHRVIEELSYRYHKDEIILGAGTVLDAATARIAILSGARYIVSPHYDEEIIKLCNRYRVPCMPGAMTIKEVLNALESGADIIKVFPGEVSGPQMIKSINGPLPQAKLMPTGGVNLQNAEQWIQAGAVAIGVGGDLIGDAKTGDYKNITEKAKQFRKVVQNAKKKLKQ